MPPWPVTFRGPSGFKPFPKTRGGFLEPVGQYRYPKPKPNGSSSDTNAGRVF